MMSHSIPLSPEMAKLTPAPLGPNNPNYFNFDTKDFNYFGALFYIILGAMTIRQNTVITESDELNANAAMQNKLNKENGQITFAVLPKGATTTQINQVQEENEQYYAIREDIQNQLITARQNAQVMMTQTSTNVNILQQDSSEDSGWLQTLNTIFKVIDQMTQR